MTSSSYMTLLVKETCLAVEKPMDYFIFSTSLGIRRLDKCGRDHWTLKLKKVL